MSKLKKQKNLEVVVLKGLCPNCYSSEVVYAEYEKNKIFGFKCRQCGWKSIYTAEEFRKISASWSRIRGEPNTISLSSEASKASEQRKIQNGMN